MRCAANGTISLDLVSSVFNATARDPLPAMTCSLVTVALNNVKL